MPIFRDAPSNINAFGFLWTVGLLSLDRVTVEALIINPWTVVLIMRQILMFQFSFVSNVLTELLPRTATR